LGILTYLVCGGFILLYIIQLIICLSTKKRLIKFIPSIIESMDFIYGIVILVRFFEEGDPLHIWGIVLITSLSFAYATSMGLAFMTSSLIKKHRERKLAINVNITQAM